MTERFRIFGHRGSPRLFPENTLASFEESLRAGADGFETDLRLLADGTAVLYHDDELGEVPIESLSMADFAARGSIIERVADLAYLAGRGTMILDVKRGHWEDILIDYVSQWPDIVIASFDHSLIASLCARSVPNALGITFSGVIANVASYAESVGATWCFPAHRYVDQSMMVSLAERQIRVVPWTANRVRDWNRLRDIGCYGAITDCPKEAVEWREAKAEERE